MQRVKNVQYDQEDLYENVDDYDEEEQGYTAEDRENFTTLIPIVRAKLEEEGLQASDREIEEALWHYYWDISKSLSYLKAAKAPKRAKPEPKKVKPKSKFDEAAERMAGSTGAIKSKPIGNGLAKKAEALTISEATTTPQISTQSKVRSKNLDVPKIWEEQNEKRKRSAAFVVIGHVDHGKSTLMGRLLLDTGAVSQRDVDKYQKQAAEIGKASFALAWVMDTGSEERERGVTVDIGQHNFSTHSADFVILDAPGHRDFIPNMIGGTSMADLAVLVVDANQLESGMRGQTKEHILLAKAMGLEKVVVAINKLDATLPAKWSEEAFAKAELDVFRLLRETGFDETDMIAIPCSGLKGDNVAKAPPTTGPAAWVSKRYPTLLKALENSVPSSPTVDIIKRPFRMQIADVFRGGITYPLSIVGRISAGHVQIGDALMMQPSGEMATIKGIEVGGELVEWAVASQISTLHLVDIDPVHLRTGDLACCARNPAPVVRGFEANITTVESILPQNVDVHLGRMHVAGSISQLLASIDARGELLKKKPRVLKTGQSGRVKVVLSESIPLGSSVERVVFRAAGVTIAYGRIDA